MLKPYSVSSTPTQLPPSLSLVELMFKKCDSKYEQIRPHPGRKGMAHSNRVTEENLEWGYSHIVGKIMDTNKMTSSRAAKCGEPGSKAEA